MQSREFMISAKVLTGLTKVHSTSQEENFQEKRSFLRTITTFGIFFWIKSNIFSDSCLKTLNRFVDTAFHVSRRNFENLLGKFFDCFVVFGSRTEISVFSDFWTNHFGNVVKRPSPVQRKRSGKNVFFRRSSIPFSSFKLWAEIYGCLGENYRMVVRFHLYMFGGSFGENHIFEKL